MVKFTRSRKYNILLHPGKNEKTLTNENVLEFTYLDRPLEINNLQYVKKNDYVKTLLYITKPATKPDEYCIWSTKDSDDMPAETKTVKNEKYLREHFETIVKGDIKSLDPYFVFTHSSKILKIRELYNAPEKRDFKPKGIFIYGPPGIGKTSIIKRWFKPSFWNEKPKIGDWFLPYNGEKIILLDELDPEYVEKYRTNINQWADGYDCTVPIKGGFTTLHHDFFVMISNYDPVQLWGPPGVNNGNNPYKQMERRLITKTFHHMDETFDCQNKQQVHEFIKIIFGNRYEEIREYLEDDFHE